MHLLFIVAQLGHKLLAWKHRTEKQSRRSAYREYNLPKNSLGNYQNNKIQSNLINAQKNQVTFYNNLLLDKKKSTTLFSKFSPSLHVQWQRIFYKVT